MTDAVSLPSRHRASGPIGVTALALPTSVMLAVGALAQEAPDWTEIGALFSARCTLCHSGDGAPLGLRLDSYEGALTGSVDGAVLVPGDVDGSELIRRVRGLSQPAMPLIGDPLTDAEIGRIEAWILGGLPEGPATQGTKRPPPRLTKGRGRLRRPPPIQASR